MRILLFLLLTFSSLHTMAQTIEQQWKTIIELENGFHFKSIIPMLDKVNQQALDENNKAYWIKGQLYKAKMELQVSENPDEVVSQVFKLFNSIKADSVLYKIYYLELLESYSRESSYKIINRTYLSLTEDTDIIYWSKRNFDEEIRKTYRELIAQDAILKNIKVEEWSFFLHLDGNEKFQPSIYDVLLYKYHRFDNSSLDLIRKRSAELLEQKNENGYLFYIDILEENWDEKLQIALKYYATDYAKLMVDKIMMHYYDATEYEKILAIKETYNSAVITGLTTSIYASEFNFSHDKYVVAQKKFPVEISHRNVDKLYVRYLAYNEDLKDIYFNEVRTALNRNDKDGKSKFEAFLKKYPAALKQDFELNLKSFSDHKWHKGVYALPGVPTGRYVVLMSNRADFAYESIYHFSELYASTKSVEIGALKKVIVSDRSTGKPLNNEEVLIYHIKGVKADYLGKYAGKLPDERNVLIKLKNEPVLYFNSAYYSYSEPSDKVRKYTQIFTDRAIYRPGQTVYFKAIVYEKDNRKGKVLPSEKITLILRDVNFKEIQKITLVTNSFGSVQAQFNLPASALSGSFRIDSDSGESYYFKVEEYKRPTFKVEIDLPKEAYALNDEVSIKGRGISFSGASMQGAQVQYSVYRERPILPRYLYISRYTEESVLIKQGNTELNDNGEFKVKFIAQAGKYEANYIYRIEARISDISGETQLKEQQIYIGNIKELVKLSHSEKLDISELNKLKIHVENLNRERVSTNGTVEIYALEQPTSVYRNSPLTADYASADRKTFEKELPHEPHFDFDKPQNWKRLEKVYSGMFTDVIQVKNVKKEGYYTFRFKTDSGVEQEEILYLSGKGLSTSKMLSYHVSSDRVQPGEKLILSFKTGLPILYLHLNVESHGNLIYEKILELKQKETLVEIPIKEEYRGNLKVNWMYSGLNSVEKDQISVEVPFEEIKISTSVVRDKLSPGQTEKWIYKIEGAQSAEILAGMYDASLDQFMPHKWNFKPLVESAFSKYQFGYKKISVGEVNSYLYYNVGPQIYPKLVSPIEINKFNFSWNGSRNIYAMNKSRAVTTEMIERSAAPVAFAEPVLKQNEEEKAELVSPTIETRKILEETAFFYPQIQVDSSHTFSLEFTVPESLTEWKLMTVGHSPDLKTGYYESIFKSQKDLMVQPNMPRFFRAGDKAEILVKISNLSNQALQGKAQLILSDEFSEKEIANTEVAFAVEEASVVRFQVNIPEGVKAIRYFIKASSGVFSDGETSVIPVLPNKIVVTETQMITVRENQSQKIDLNLKNTAFQITFELTANPLWIAVMALPYLSTYPYDCSEQVFSKLFSNLLAQKLVNDNPAIQNVFSSNKELKESKLRNNQELKNIVLEETPWLLDAESEEEQYLSLATLFQANQLKNQIETQFQSLTTKQNSSGGFPWFSGGRDNLVVTQHIVSGFGMLKQMGITMPGQEALVQKAIEYCDQTYLKYYEENKKTLSTASVVDYWYARSYYFKEIPLNKSLDKALQLSKEEMIKEFKNLSLFSQGQAISLFIRLNQLAEARNFAKYVVERTVDSAEMGMYWNNNVSGWSWYASPVESQVNIMEALYQLGGYEAEIEKMKIWLLRNRQTHHWSSTKSTTRAIFALLNMGKDWKNAEKGVKVYLDANLLASSESVYGTGYVKKTFTQLDVPKEIKIEKTSPGLAYGAVFKQFELPFNEIESSQTGIRLKKELFVQKTDEKGKNLVPLTQGIKVGDLLTVRLEIQVDRSLEFVHIKDLRASGLEPINTLSGYRFQGSMGYYESIRDVAHHFFIDYLPKGSYVFEYQLKANMAGTFENGILQIQNMYAPELSAHSGSIRIEIEK